jgi:hypothetical protein
VVPVARPGHPRVCGRKKTPEGVALLLLQIINNSLVTIDEVGGYMV